VPASPFGLRELESCARRCRPCLTELAPLRSHRGSLEPALRFGPNCRISRSPCPGPSSPPGSPFPRGGARLVAIRSRFPRAEGRSPPHCNGDEMKRGSRCPTSNDDGMKRGSRRPIANGNGMKRGSRCPIANGDEMKRGNHRPTSNDDGLKRGSHCPTSNGDGMKRGGCCPLDLCRRGISGGIRAPTRGRDLPAHALPRIGTALRRLAPSADAPHLLFGPGPAASSRVAKTRGERMIASSRCSPSAHRGS
jgi:hypothetical protein